MKAASFERIGDGRSVIDVPDPVADAGDVVFVDVAASVLTYAHGVLSGQRPMLFELPFVPGTGGIGPVGAIGLSATELKAATDY